MNVTKIFGENLILINEKIQYLILAKVGSCLKEEVNQKLLVGVQHLDNVNGAC